MRSGRLQSQVPLTVPASDAASQIPSCLSKGCRGCWAVGEELGRREEERKREHFWPHMSVKNVGSGIGKTRGQRVARHSVCAGFWSSRWPVRTLGCREHCPHGDVGKFPACSSQQGSGKTHAGFPLLQRGAAEPALWTGRWGPEGKGACARGAAAGRIPRPPSPNRLHLSPCHVVSENRNYL